MAVYYVDKGVGAGGAGTEGDPFDSILDAFDACFPAGAALAEDTTIYLKSTSGTPDVVESTPTMEYTAGHTLTLVQTDRTSPAWDDTKYRLVRANSECLATSGSGGHTWELAHRLTCLNVQFEQSSNSANTQTMIRSHTSRGRRGIFLFDSCMFKGSGDDTYSKEVFRCDSDRRFAALTVIRNCVIFNMGMAGGRLIRASIFGDSPGNIMFVNNTVDAEGISVALSTNSPVTVGLVHFYNNILNLGGFGGARHVNDTSIVNDYNTCFFEDEDVIDSVDGVTVVWTHGANEITNVISLPFSGEGDYRLSQTDAQVVDQGLSFEADYDMPGHIDTPDAPGFTHDHLETSTRPQGAAWDIGAYEFIAFNYPRFLMGPKA